MKSGSSGREQASSKEDVVIDDERKPRGIQSIITGFKVLDCLAEAPSPLGLKALADETGMPASKLRFYLVSFLELGLVSQDGVNGRYSLGPAALKLGLSALEKVDVVRMVRSEIAGLADALGYTVFIAVWGTHGPTIIDRVDGRSRTVLEIRVGSVLPLMSSACGRVFSAFMPRASVAPLLRKERQQWVGNQAGVKFDPDNSQELIRRTRLARASETLLTGFTAIASPVLDRSGTPIAVLSVVGAVGKLPDDIDDKPARALLDITTRLSQQVGWSAPGGKG